MSKAEFVCYFCKDFEEHENCVGACCHCPCPLPDERERQRLRRQAVAKLTWEEQQALGVDVDLVDHYPPQPTGSSSKEEGQG